MPMLAARLISLLLEGGEARCRLGTGTGAMALSGSSPGSRPGGPGFIGQKRGKDLKHTCSPELCRRSETLSQGMIGAGRIVL